MRFLCSGLALLLTAIAAGSDVPLGHPDFQPTPQRPIGWRGDGSGVFPAATPPVEWDGDSGLNLKWKADLPWWGCGSPVVAHGKVVLGVEPHTLLAYDSDTGKLLWHNARDQFDVLFPAEEAKAKRAAWGAIFAGGVLVDRKSYPVSEWAPLGCFTNPYQGATFATPVCDGERIYTAWASNTMACYNLSDGACVWMIFLGPTKMYGEALDPKADEAQLQMCCERWAPSPVLVDGVLIAHQGGIFHGVDAGTGKILWRKRLNQLLEGFAIRDREHSIRRKPGPQGHAGSGSLIAMDLSGTTVVVTPQGIVFRPRDGHVLCPYIGGTCETLCASPGFDDERDLVYMTDFQEGGVGASPNLSFGIKLSLKDADTVAAEVLWSSKDVEGFPGSVTAWQGVLYNGSAWDGATGRPLAKVADARGGYSSFSIAGDLLIRLENGWGTVQQLSSGLADAKAKAVRRLHGRMGIERDPKDKFDSKLGSVFATALRERAAQAIAAGIIPHYSTAQKHGGWDATYGSNPYFHGRRMYVRTRLSVFCFERPETP